MPQTTIIPEYVNLPREGKKKGSIKTKDGRYYSIDPNQLQLFKKGVPITVVWYSNEFNGKTYYHIKDIIPDQDSNAVPVGTKVQGSGELVAEVKRLATAVEKICDLLTMRLPQQQSNPNEAPF